MVSNGRTVSYTGHAMETKEVAWKALHKRKVARFHRVAHRYVAIARDVELMVCLNSPPSQTFFMLHFQITRRPCFCFNERQVVIVDQ